MARIRSIKPEFWTSEQVVECSPIARLLFVGMWTFADDGGNFPESMKRIKMQVFPADDISTNTLRGLVEELKSEGLLKHYVFDSKGYYHITGWHHQRIDRPTYRFPEYEPELDTSNIQHPIESNSSSPRRALTPGEERRGEERSGGDKERSGEDTPNSHNIDSLKNKGTSCTEAENPPSAPTSSAEPPVFELPIIASDKPHPVTQSKIDKWSKAYPAVDVMQQLRQIEAWIDANPAKRKTKRGIEGFITRWLSKEQDRGGSGQRHNGNSANRSKHSGFGQRDYHADLPDQSNMPGFLSETEEA